WFDPRCAHSGRRVGRPSRSAPWLRTDALRSLRSPSRCESPTGRSGCAGWRRPTRQRLARRASPKRLSLCTLVRARVDAGRDGVSELSWWFAPHPDWEPTEDWPEEVPVVRYGTDNEVVLIDPF